MTSALYRIEVGRDLHTPQWPWTAAIYRLADGPRGIALAMERGATQEEALERASEWVAAEALTTPELVVYFDRLGHRVAAPAVTGYTNVPTLTTEPPYGRTSTQ